MMLDLNTVAEICRRNDIQKLLVFGSVAREEDRPSSDIHLIAYFSVRKSLLDIIGIEQDFSETLARKVDLLTEGAISKYLKDEVMGEAKVIFEEAA